METMAEINVLWLQVLIYWSGVGDRLIPLAVFSGIGLGALYVFALMAKWEGRDFSKPPAWALVSWCVLIVVIVFTPGQSTIMWLAGLEYGPEAVQAVAEMIDRMLYPRVTP